VAVAGSYAYVADVEAGLRVIDVSDPANPRERGYYDTRGGTCGVAVADSYAYVADWGAGLRVIEYYGAGNREAPSAEVRTPNCGATIVRGILFLPVSPITVHSSLFDHGGRKVMELRPGGNDVRHLSPGVYFVRRQDTGESARLVLVR
jgi:hypothetical protein